ncbi:hypothetical protein [Flexibacterium corallicola]|uniref:hypothetical protein n=1 Tax=Flexibacterium corallicola TaxID=3037259 RepID=UPI00286ED15D|nr:hypothetical protein [Pseudovibrio sp. M1P-2-3]
MIWLQSASNFNSLALLDTSNSSIEFIDRSAERAPISKTGHYDYISGTFDILNDFIFAYFKNDNKIYVLAGSNIYEINNRFDINISGSPNNRILSISIDNIEVMNLNYLIDTSIEFDNDFTQWDEEDNDFGLNLYNFCKSKTRQNVLLGLE